MERVGGLERLLEVPKSHAAPTWLRPGGTVGYGHHLLPVMLLVLVPLVVIALQQCRVIAIIPTAEVGGSFDLVAEVGLDHLLCRWCIG
jgi:hypothetical protein